MEGRGFFFRYRFPSRVVRFSSSHVSSAPELRATLVA
jgi:hypothetical protein